MSMKVMMAPQIYVQGPGALSKISEHIDIFSIRNPHYQKQGIKGIRRQVRILSRLDSKMRVERIAGTLQPKPRIKGDTDFPCNPILCMSASVKKAMRVK